MYERAYKQFEKIDKDHDRRINFEEFKKGRSLFGLSKDTKESEIKKQFDEIDRDKGGMVLFEEFCMYLAKESLLK
jgi:Ca2+-binding EF-hand superfamily protein